MSLPNLSIRDPQKSGLAAQPADNVNISGGVLRNVHVSNAQNRYYLKEYFERKPGINADIQNAAEATREIVNPNFEVLGTNSSSDDVTVSATRAGMQLQTDGGAADQVIILPHLDANQSAWTGVLWGTENQVEWECAISTSTLATDIIIWAGLKLTNTPVIATDANQVFFRFSTTDSNTTWRVIDSIADVDVNTNSGVTVAAATIYHFRISIDASRIARCFINDALVRTTSALTNDIDLIPYVGVNAVDAAVHEIILHYEHISRILFE